MSAKVESPSAAEPRRAQLGGGGAATGPKVSMFGAKSGFVIRKNKLSGSLVPITRGGDGEADAAGALKDDRAKRVQRKTKWGVDLTQDPAVRRARALAYQARVEQITKMLNTGALELGEDQESAKQDKNHDSVSQIGDTERHKAELLELEKQEAIGEILRLNPNYKAPPDYKPLLKEAKVPIPIKAYPGCNFIGLILGSESSAQKRLENLDSEESQGAFEDIYVNISADTFEKVDAAVALIELLVTPVSGNPAVASVTTAPILGENQNQAVPSGHIIPDSSLNQVPQAAMVGSPTTTVRHSSAPTLVPPVGSSALGAGTLHTFAAGPSPPIVPSIPSPQPPVSVRPTQAGPVKAFSSHTATVNDLSFDKEGEYIGSCSDDGFVVIHSLFTDERMKFEYHRPMKAIAVDPEYSQNASRRFIAGELAGNLFLNTKKWLGYRDQVLHSGEGPIHAVKWRTSLVAWANDAGVKVYDMANNQRLTFIERPQRSPRPELLLPQLVWQDDTLLVIGWGTCVKIAAITTNTAGAANGAMKNISFSSVKYVDIVASFQTSYFISGIAPYGDALVVLAYIPEEENGEKEFSSALPWQGAAQRPEVHIVTWKNEELATDALPVRGYEHYRAKDYMLAHAPFTGSSYAGGQWAAGDEPLYYIVSPKDVVIARPRDAEDHINWLVRHGYHEKALAAVEAGQGRTELLGEVGAAYLDHLILERKYAEAASLCPKLLHGSASAWERWVFHFAHLRQLPVLVPYIPTENPRLNDTAYEVALVALATNQSFHKDLLSTVKFWPPVIYSVLPVISAIELQLNTSSETDMLKEALAELYVINSQYERALALYADLRKLEIFEFIEKHSLHDAIQDKIDLYADYEPKMLLLFFVAVNNIGLTRHMKFVSEKILLRDRLVKIITDYRTETSLRQGCNDILKADCVNLLLKLYNEERRAVYLGEDNGHGKTAPQMNVNTPNIRTSAVKCKFDSVQSKCSSPERQRDSSDPTSNDGPASDRIFVRVDNNPYTSAGFFDDGDVHDDRLQSIDGRDSIFADAPDEEDGTVERIGGVPFPAWYTSLKAPAAPLPDDVRREILELGLPDDGYNYLLHLREIKNAGGGSSYYQNSKAKLDQVPFDVKAYDASRVRISSEVDEDSNLKSIYSVASKTVGVKIQRAVDPEVSALLDDSDLSRFGSDVEDLEEDFVVQANLLEDGKEGETEEVVERIGRSDLNGGVNDEHPWKAEADFVGKVESRVDQWDGGVEFVGEEPRIRRPLDEQFDLAEKKFEDELLAAKLNDVLKDYKIDDLELEDKYKVPHDLLKKDEGSKGDEELESVVDVIRKCAEYAEMYSLEDQDEEIVVVEESSDESEKWDCETIVSTYSNLDNHPGKIQAPNKPRKRLPDIVSGALGATGNVISLRRKEKLPVEFLPHGKKTVTGKVKKAVNSGAEQPQRKSRDEESKEEKKERKAAIKKERGEARRAKKELKSLYRAETQLAQRSVAIAGPSSIHLM
ncbi:hypothetical protein QJS10_CPA01g00116 [Acorus calamus]|uniref:Vps41 beta-propeller domain-containing protein n=1 Tax=Acorus calamus TaxID=4465 RepID=A0AAV9FS26_ACOCL|nr:hypothetical protein QJS10_CPA01g00116 [Acorus calamus]